MGYRGAAWTFQFCQAWAQLWGGAFGTDRLHALRSVESAVSYCARRLQKVSNAHHSGKRINAEIAKLMNHAAVKRVVSFGSGELTPSGHDPYAANVSLSCVQTVRPSPPRPLRRSLERGLCGPSPPPT